MTEEERDKVVVVAESIRAGKCPFGLLEEGKSMAHCPLGFPGCACADELLANPFLADILDKRLEKYNDREEEVLL